MYVFALHLTNRFHTISGQQLIHLGSQAGFDDVYGIAHEHLTNVWFRLVYVI